MDSYTAGLRQAAFEYGIKHLAHDLDMSEGRLYKKLDPDSGVSLTLADYFRINRTLKDLRCIDRALEDLGMVATPVEKAADDIEGEIRELLLDQHDMAAGFVRLVRQAKADGEICDNDLEEIKAFRRELAVMGNTVMRRVEAMHKKGAALKAVK
ncbi:phage regulatory CII family protein [Halomonas aquamarina]|uniref:Phage regulatory CII family protein n=1 Tax=Vreelandella aquamarina TaxID=77097 RepID=A0ACC5VRT1_9GAMM|nr:phage regulatory CII family protein [Halomonas aquamarina]MBZ5486935.1 phage regulatory CII family protein [Halomonas aquamarina]